MPAAGLLARSAHTYAAGRFGQHITLLFAGAATATASLDAAELLGSGVDASVSLIDDDQRATRAAVAGQAGLSRCTLGDLRTVPLPPRAYDIVYCTRLLDRISHAELVLDRLTAALKPGGLLLLQFRDRECAAGFLDRALPGLARRLAWRMRKSGQPGPHPAVYEPLASARGVQAYALLRGLVIAERQAQGGRAGGMADGPPGTSRGFLTVQRMVAALSRGHLTAGHEELLYVLRKPEHQFARVL